MNKLNLPKEHLSVSQVNLWINDPAAYMKRYFLNIEDAPSPMLEFGKQFAQDLEDYSKGIDRDYNFPPNFFKEIKLYALTEYKLEHDFGNFKFIGYIDNCTENYNIIRDFKTGTVDWSPIRLETSLQMKVYALILYHQYEVFPTCIIDYYKTKMVKGKIEWAGLHETYTHVFSYKDLMETEALIHRVAAEIHHAYEVHRDAEINDMMAKYINIHKEEKMLLNAKESLRASIEEKLKSTRYINRISDCLVNYSTYEKKSYIYSKALTDKESEVEALKKQEVLYGIAEAQSKTITLLTVKDAQ
jgi:hypothetical protein